MSVFSASGLSFPIPSIHSSFSTGAGLESPPRGTDGGRSMKSTSTSFILIESASYTLSSSEKEGRLEMKYAP